MDLHYPTFEAFLSDASQGSANVVTGMTSDWYGNISRDEALSLARNGWPEGTAKIAHISTQIVDKITSLIEIPTIQYDVCGLDFDMGTYLSGAPECWYDFRADHVDAGKGTKFVKVVYNFGARAYVTPETMMARGFTTAALVQSLESAGIRVELIAVNRVINVYPELDFRIPVKSADQSLDIDRLSFVLAHPAMLRRLGFAVRSLHVSAMGGSVEYADHGDIYIDAGVGSEWLHTDSAVKWILDQLKLQGVHLIGQGE